ncbi:GNAT family N-acetyltransferase [Brevibacillus sp. H7]|uniref:GNAT family N-acetyltransferase n=1 Tax=Brevibacillus sp. H7 TaxID=3349138 RepID=UPI00380A102D
MMNIHKATIVSLYVKPESRGKGVAAQLVEAVIAYIRERTSVEQLQLSVVTVNRAARKLYERIGFTLYGEEKHALKVGERYYDEYHMVLPLNEKKGTE